MKEDNTTQSPQGKDKTTPTPWIAWETPMVHQGKYFQCPVESAHPDGIIYVAMAFGVTIEECKANADLIAKAPELDKRIEELEAAVWVLLHHVPDTEDFDPIRAKCKAALNNERP